MIVIKNRQVTVKIERGKNLHFFTPRQLLSLEQSFVFISLLLSQLHYYDK